MGKAVPKSLKTIAEILMEEFPKEVSHDFDKNKEFLNTLELSLSKSQRNLVAGYIARKTEKPKETEHKSEKPQEQPKTSVETKETEQKTEKPQEQPKTSVETKETEQKPVKPISK